MPKRRTIAAAVATGTTVLGMAAAMATTTAAQAAPALHSLARTKPAWTAHARHAGAASGGATVTARVYLAPKGGIAALRNYATQVSTPGSANYRHFLTAAEYQARFGTTHAAVAKVRSYLTSSGLRVTRVGADNQFLAVRGTVAATDRAFHTQLLRFRHDGQLVRAPKTAAKVPSSLATAVLTVTGLDTTPHVVTPASHQAAPPPPGFRNARPCSMYYGQVTAKYQADYKTPLPTFKGNRLPYAVCGYTGPQFRAAYEGNTPLDGSGVTVAITDAYAAPTIAKDANTYAKRHGDGAYSAGQLTQVDPAKFTHKKECGPQGWYGEETLDVEAVHAMAPAANIRYYASSSCNDTAFIDTLARVVRQDKAQLVTNSWSDVEEAESADAVAAYEQVFMQGAAEGISFLFSSGDNGDEVATTGLRQVDYPASDPYVTGVGGTADAIGPNGTFEFQTGWGTHKFSLSSDGSSWQSVGYLYGAGGGSSALFNRPSYQNGVVRSASRQVPDVGLDADPTTGMLVGETQTFPNGKYYDEYRIGGTSLASPLFAGMTALTLQHAGGGLGYLNPVIYSNRKTAFNDIAGAPADAGNVRVDYVNGINGKDGLAYSVRTFNQDSSLRTKPGYDNVTGVGSPNPAWLTVGSAG